jgi:hypothetical protein
MVYLAGFLSRYKPGGVRYFAFGPNSGFFSQKASEVSAGGCGDAAWSPGMWRVSTPEHGGGAEFRLSGAGTGFIAERARTKFANNSAESSYAS